jgi:hypothetical protein
MSYGGVILYGTQDLGQLRRAEFASSTGPVAIPGQTCFGHEAQVKPRSR